MKKQQGFTLIEIAIVLVIIGLLLGGVLKGQELITAARVRNLISLQDGTKAAFFGFQDRFRAYPGDYAQAATIGAVQGNINGATVNGDGNGLIQSPTSVPAPAVAPPINEDTAVWEHLSRAGFINGSYTYAGAVSAATSALNPYSVPMQLVYDNQYGDAGVAQAKHNLKTGNLIPAEIIAEIDRKIDDGDALRGSFRFSDYAPAGNAPVGAGGCYTAGTGQWIVAGAAVSPNCGGASLF